MCFDIKSATIYKIAKNKRREANSSSISVIVVEYEAYRVVSLQDAVVVKNADGFRGILAVFASGRINIRRGGAKDRLHLVQGGELWQLNLFLWSWRHFTFDLRGREGSPEHHQRPGDTQVYPVRKQTVWAHYVTFALDDQVTWRAARPVCCSLDSWDLTVELVPSPLCLMFLF